jgi:hypothetical protein
LLHALLAVGLSVLSWLFAQLDATGVARLLNLGAVCATVLVGAGFAVRFFSVLLSGSDRPIPAEPPPSSLASTRHWTETALMAWTSLCLAALVVEAYRVIPDDPRRALFALLFYAPMVGLFAMQAVRLVRAERRIPAP